MIELEIGVDGESLGISNDADCLLPRRSPLQFSFVTEGMVSKRDLVTKIRKYASRRKFTWLKIESKEWKVDISALKHSKAFNLFNEDQRRALAWLDGTVYLEPEYVGDRTFDLSSIVLYVDPTAVAERRSALTRTEPVEIRDSITAFRNVYSDAMKVAFLMMKFGETDAHNRFVKAIRNAFAAHGITVLRADDRQFHDDLFLNVQTYMHGCGMGVAVFERIQGEEFNPNASLEVGYMMSMQKPLCLLKDQSLRTLPTDLVSRLYKPFDVHNPEGTIPGHVEKWIRDKGLSRRPRRG